MSSDRPRSRRAPRSRLARWAIAPIGLAAVIVLAGCTQEQAQGFLPGGPDVTNHTGGMIDLWVNSWIVLLAVGAVTWGVIIWAAIAYRRRTGQTGMPAQMRYHMPIEIFYTIVPFILVLGFFAFTVREQTSIETDPGNPDVKIEVFGKRWSWDFNYLDEKVYSPGIQAQDRLNSDGSLDESELPTLYLPVGEKVQIDIESRDVAHSFWVLDFLYKKDMIPGQTNHMYFIPTKEGTYQGKCAELCGEYHSLMLFQVKVVSPEEYDTYIQSLRDLGQVGRLGPEYNVNQNLPGIAPASGSESAE
ncbi:MAG: cytochrome c oxidase subunit II [Actinomycetales bacterium]|nr:cytochrome c oxidase subunit II [Actinomycetales bacterium]